MNEIIFNGPANVQTDYYSGINVTLWCRGTWIDDVDNIMYVETSEDRPLFGYHSKYYSGMATGRQIVQGTFSVGFIAPDYLQKIILVTEPEPQVRQDIKETGKAFLFLSLEDRLAGDSAWQVANVDVDRHYKTLQGLATDSQYHELAKSRFNEAVRRRSQARSRILYDMAITLADTRSDVIMLLEDDPQETQLIQPIDMSPFDIRIHYGDPVDMRASGIQMHREQSRRIVGVKITRTEHRVNTSGEALVDVHSFFGQRITY